MNPIAESSRTRQRATLVGVLAVLVGCGGGAGTPPEPGTGGTGGAPTGGAGTGATAGAAGGQAGRAAGGSGGTGGSGNAGAGATGGTMSSGGTAGGGTGGGGMSGRGAGGAGGSVVAGGGGTGGTSTGGAAGSTAGGTGGSAGRAGAGAGGIAGSAGGGAAGQGGAAAGRGGAAGGGAGGTGGASYQPCPTSGACKIMPFGDSITQGYNVQGGYRAPLFHLAHQDGHDITFVGSASDYSVPTVDGVTFPKNHEGHGGYTIDDNASHNTKGISPLVATSMKNYTPNIVTLMIGTNDINGNIDVSSAPTRLGALLDSIYAANADVLIILAQIVPTTNDGTNNAVRTYNSAMPALVSARTGMGRHLVLVDMYGAFTKDSSYKTSLMGDGLHPNQAGYNLMADTWYAALKGYLR